MKPASSGDSRRRPKLFGAVTRNVPVTPSRWRVNASRACSRSAITRAAYGYSNLPSSVNDRLRVLRWINCTPRRRSNPASRLLIAASVSPSSEAAAVRLPAAATRSNAYSPGKSSNPSIINRLASVNRLDIHLINVPVAGQYPKLNAPRKPLRRRLLFGWQRGENLRDHLRETQTCKSTSPERPSS